jgi:hypothetical protein
VSQLSLVYTKEFKANVPLKSSIPIGAKVEINTLDVVFNVKILR